MAQGKAALRQWIQEVGYSIANEAGDQVTASITLVTPKSLTFKRPSPQLASWLLNTRAPGDWEGLLRSSQNISDSWATVLSSTLKAWKAALSNSWTEAYTASSQVHSAFLAIFRSEERSWSLPVLMGLSRDLRVLAVKADEEELAAGVGGKQEKLEDSARFINTAATVCINDRTPEEDRSRRGGALPMILHLFRIYFRLSNLRLCRNLIATAENPRFPPLESFDVPDVVTYRYFVGRYSLFDSGYVRADKELSWAYDHCPRSAASNRAAILTLLIPVKMLSGRLPSQALLASSPTLAPFAPLAQAVRTGDLATLNKAMATHQAWFIEKGIYLLIERLRAIVLRTLTKRVAKMLASTRVPIASMVSALAFLGETADPDEVECLLANLITTGYIRGYLSHAKRTMVLAGSNAFPPLQG